MHAPRHDFGSPCGLSSAMAFVPVGPLTRRMPQNSVNSKCRRRTNVLPQTHSAFGAPCVMTAGTPRSQSAVPLAPKVSDIWELDFYARPVMGMDGKKLWELIITDTTGSFEHVEAIPNSLVNSRHLKERIQAVIESAPVKPTIIRFFRMQMRNMISIALSDLDVQIRPSRRTYALLQAIKYREQNVYPQMPGFKASLMNQPASFAGPDLTMAQRLPDALRCDSFSFASFPLDQLQDFFETANPKEYFGEQCLVDPNVATNALIPGLVIYSTRAPAIAGWMSGVELAAVQAKLDKQEIILECGLDTRYKFGAVTRDIREEAKSFQANKTSVEGLHFLAVQKSEDSDEIDGLWLLCDI